MGFALLDEYSLLHFASGIVLYYWNFSLTQTILGHSAFELFENSDGGMRFINDYFYYNQTKLLKTEPDNITNMFGDTMSCIAGYMVAQMVFENP